MIETEVLSRSKECLERLRRYIPGGVNSPARACKGLGVDPVIAERGADDLLYDVDGKEYIDYCGSWGALILGHAPSAVVKSSQEQLAKGSTFGLSTKLEADLAELIVEMVPSIEQVRFVSTGTEATMTAVRLARGFTGRNGIIKFKGNYHGHADAFLVEAGSSLLAGTPTASSAGIPEDSIKHTFNLAYNDLEAIETHFMQQGDKIAAVIVEPVAGNMGVVPAQPNFLRALRNLCSGHGALLIFDEVISGFRLSAGGAQQLYGVWPDLTCLGKIVGGGMPAAAIGGRAEIMQRLAPLGPVYQAGTLSGNPIAMAAGVATLQELRKPGFYQELERKARLLCDPIEEVIKEKGLEVCLQRAGSMFTLFFGKRAVKDMKDAQRLNLQLFARFFDYLLKAGIYAPPSQHEAWFVSAAHTDLHLSYTSTIIKEFLEKQL